jgi:hypothetical protein
LFIALLRGSDRHRFASQGTHRVNRFLIRKRTLTGGKP